MRCGPVTAAVASGPGCREAASGECHLDPAVAKLLAASLRTPRPAADSLTARERQVLTLIAGGATNRQIARQLGVTERTARTHVSNILAKLQLSSRTQAALWAVHQGLASAPNPADPGRVATVPAK